MNTFSRLMRCGGCTDRITYQRNVSLLALGKSAVDLLVLSSTPSLAPTTIAVAWLNPFALVRPWSEGTMPSAICLSTLFFFAALVWNSVHRARHAGWPHTVGLVTAVPCVGLPMALILALLPAKKHSVWDLV
jgi:hypothetical protein